MQSVKLKKFANPLIIFLKIYAATGIFVIVTNVIDLTWMESSLGLSSSIPVVFLYNIHNLISFINIFFIIYFIYKSQSYNFERGVPDLKYSTTWIWIWWFIPIFNLWMPLRVVSEIYLSSFEVKKDRLDSNDYNIIHNWWGSWIIGLLLTSLAGPLYRSFIRQGFLGDSFYPIYIFEIVGSFLLCISALSFISIINVLVSNQLITKDR